MSTQEPGNGLRYQVQDHERRLSHMEQQPVTEMRVDLQYLKNEVKRLEQVMKEGMDRTNNTVTWILRTLVAACITLLMGVLIWILNGGPPA